MGTPVRFDRFTLDPGDERLIGAHGPVRIGNKAYRVLQALIQQQGRLLTKEMLFETVWDGTIVSESALTSVIKELRRALGDDPKTPTFIESVYGRGYRFLPQVDAADAPPAPASRAAPIDIRERQPAAGSLAGSVAVMPFAEMGEGVEDWLADSVVEEIVVALTRFHSLFVISPMSSLNFRDTKLDRPSICSALGVRYLLEGSVRRSGNRVRVTARLVDGREDQQIWADKFDDTLDDIFALHDRIALAVAGRIGSSIDDAETRRLAGKPAQTSDTMALYARANALLRKVRPDSLRTATELCAQILEREPGNAWAASMAAFCHGLLVNMGWSADPEEDRRKALAYCDFAMDGASDDERVLAFCGSAINCVRGDPAVATRLVERAVEVNPGSAAVQFWAGWNDTLIGEAARGFDRLENSQRLNPLSELRPLQIIPKGICLILQRRYDEAIAVLGEAVQLAPTAGALAPLTAALALAGRLDEARATHLRLLDVGGSKAGLDLLQRAEDRALIDEAFALVEHQPAAVAA